MQAPQRPALVDDHSFLPARRMCSPRPYAGPIVLRRRAERAAAAGEPPPPASRGGVSVPAALSTWKPSCAAWACHQRPYCCACAESLICDQ